MQPLIVRNDACNRFETVIEHELCVLDYRLAKGVFVIEHVGVPAAVGGRGIASALVSAALETARAEHWRVVANCSYAAGWLERNPQYSDLLDRG